MFYYIIDPYFSSSYSHAFYQKAFQYTNHKSYKPQVAALAYSHLQTTAELPVDARRPELPVSACRNEIGTDIFNHKSRL